MKKLALSLSLFVMASAHAASMVVLEIPTSHWTTGNETVFEVNKSQGRAWVALFAQQGRRNDRVYQEHRTRVPGLYFDASSSKIMLEKDGGLIECANVRTRGRSIFRHDKITPTGCQLQVKRVKKQIDDGYRGYKVDMTQVHLITR